MTHTVVDVVVDWNKRPQERYKFQLTPTQDVRIAIKIPADAAPRSTRQIELYDYSDGVTTTGDFKASIAFGTDPNNWSGPYTFIETHFLVQVADAPLPPGMKRPTPVYKQGAIVVQPGQTYYVCLTLAHGDKVDGRKNNKAGVPFGAAVELLG